jgi:hypothetical protein
MKQEIIMKHKEEYMTAWEDAVNKYVREFTIDFCDEKGPIDWEKLLKFNSGGSASA